MLRSLLLAYAGCCGAHVACCWFDASMQGVPLHMSIDEILTGWWPILATAARDIHSMCV